MHRSIKLFSVLMMFVLALAALPASSALAAPDTQGPLTSAVTVVPNPTPYNTLATLTATVDDTTTGGSNILSAEYSLNGGAFVAMTAVDGAFDSPTENVTATFTAATFGANQVCVRGTDVLNNVSTPVCASFNVPDIFGPLTTAVVITPNPVPVNTMAVLTAKVDDTTTGGSLIKSAEYSLNGGAFTAMTAVDGAFNSVSENVKASFKVTKIGDNQVCVRGTDVLNNVGNPVCITFKAVYIFKGFFPPIRMGVNNKANAPQAIPVKWQLLTGDLKPVANKASFVAVESYALDCKTLTGDPTTAIKESAPGKSGLIYEGKGFWHFNWKTSKAYRHTCRAMFVLFNSGQTSPQVVFIFK